jgi:hypothetical protein
LRAAVRFPQPEPLDASRVAADQEGNRAELGKRVSPMTETPTPRRQPPQPRTPKTCLACGAPFLGLSFQRAYSPACSRRVQRAKTRAELEAIRREAGR